jgi:hypothetical protein
MPNSGQTAPHQAQRPRDYRLLLHSLEQASFDEEGRDFVDGSFAGQPFWAGFEDQDVLRLASITRQHGLIEKSLAIYSWLIEKRPSCQKGWSEHLEMLYHLGRNGEVVALLARAARHLPPEELIELKSLVNGLSPGESVQESATSALDPFVEMRRAEEDTVLFMRLFRGREDAFARQWADRDQGRQGYVPVTRPLGADDIRAHLQGRKTFGIYLLTTEAEVFTGVIDVDLVAALRPKEARKKARDTIRREAIYLYRRISERAAAAGLACICEMSGGKGYHFWFPAAGPVPAVTMKKALESISRGLVDDVSVFSLEVFPKQHKLSGKGFGNLVKLPLGVHRATGKRSRFIPLQSATMRDQIAFLRTIEVPAAEPFQRLAASRKAEVIIHPRHEQWAQKFPELATLSTRCAMLGQIVSLARSAKALSLAEEKVLIGVLAHLPRGRLLLHHLCATLPEYNRPLLDYKISRVRGTVLGCKRIHRLLDDHVAELPCVFSGSGYPHPLRHFTGQDGSPQPVAEKAATLQDALLSLKTAIEQIQRFL